MMYQILPVDEYLAQGDILDGCPIPNFEDPLEIEEGEFATSIWHERVVVLTQACDLTQSKTSKVLVALLQPAAVLVDQGELKAATIRDQIRRGLVYGWYFLPAAPSPVALPESIVDLRDLHTIPRSILEGLVAGGKRICRVATPYREHLAQHFGITYMRIGLPAPYETE